LDKTPQHFSHIDVGHDASQVLNFAELPFPSHRIYWLVGPSEERGGHAHKILQQTLFCLAGQVVIDLLDGKVTETIRLRAGAGIELEPGLWRVIRPLDSNSILLVTASDKFDEDEYIRDYAEFLRWKNV